LQRLLIGKPVHSDISQSDMRNTQAVRRTDPSEMTMSYEPWGWGWGWLEEPNVFAKTQGAKT